MDTRDQSKPINHSPSFKIADLTIDPPVCLAPMVGLTHLAFRQIVASFGGCGLYFSEMLSARKLPQETTERSMILHRFSNESPFFYQILGNTPEDMAFAVKHVEQLKDEKGNPPDGIDINMGCSAPEIRRQGSGSALMIAQDKARSIVAECRKQTKLPLTAKMRLGETEDIEGLLGFIRSLQEEGLDAVTLHPRLIREKFKRTARWKYIKAVKENISIPVIGNGDIEDVSDIDRRIQETGCDGVMIGRLAVTEPWIFKFYRDGKKPEVDKKDLYFEFIDLLRKFYNPKDRIRRLIDFTNYYSKNFVFGHQLMKKIGNAPDIDSAVLIAERFFEAESV